MGMKTHFAGAVIVKEERNLVSVILQGSISIDRRFRTFGKLVYKFPGGTNTDYPKDWDTRKTLRREIKEELGLHLKRGVNPRRLCTISEGQHTKVFFVLRDTDLEGHLRDKEIVDGLTLLRVPEWVQIDKAVGMIYESHLPVITEVKKYLGLMG